VLLCDVGHVMNSVCKYLPTTAAFKTAVSIAVDNHVARFALMEQVRQLGESEKTRLIDQFQLWVSKFLYLDRIVNQSYPMLAASLLLAAMSFEVLTVPLLIQYFIGATIVADEQRWMSYLGSVAVAMLVLCFVLVVLKRTGDIAIAISHASLKSAWFASLIVGITSCSACCYLFLLNGASLLIVHAISATAVCAICLATPLALFPILDWVHSAILKNWYRSVPDVLIACSLFEILCKLKDETHQWVDIQFRVSLIPSIDRVVACLEVGMPNLYGDFRDDGEQAFTERVFQMSAVVRAMKARLLVPRDGTREDLERQAGEMVLRVIRGNLDFDGLSEKSGSIELPRTRRRSRLFTRIAGALIPLCAFGVMQFTALRLEGEIGINVARVLVVLTVVRFLRILESPRKDGATGVVESIGGILKDVLQSREL